MNNARPRHRPQTPPSLAGSAVALAAAVVALSCAVGPEGTACAFAPASASLPSRVVAAPAFSSAAFGASASASAPAPLSMALEDDGSAAPSSPSADIVLSGAADAAVLSAAFESLPDSDKYDAVLTGLCAKLLDNPGGPLGALGPAREAELAASSPADRALAALEDPLRLLGEMTARSIPASSRSLAALIDAAAGCSDPGAVAATISAMRRNGGMINYGSLQGDVVEMPPRDDARVTLRGDGTSSTMTKRMRLDGLPDVPADERGAEVAAALAAGGIGTFCLGFSGVSGLFGMEDLNGLVNAFLTLSVGVLVLDNFYDAIRAVSNLIGSASKEKLPRQVQDATKDVSMPEKDQLPMGLGSGALTGTVVRGFSRLATADTERECACEAAAFFAAYALGLPSFAFRPNALEAAVLIVESVNSKDDSSPGSSSSSDLDPLLSDAGVLKVLIWLMAPVALESSRHPVLMASDPREGVGLLRRLRDRAGTILGDDKAEELAEVLREPGGPDEDDLLRWAYAEADLLLRENKRTVQDLAERMTGGAATVADCVASLEGW